MKETGDREIRSIGTYTQLDPFTLPHTFKAVRVWGAISEPNRVIF